MFSDNDKISARQIKRLLVLDLLAKSCLLLPWFAQASSARDFLVSLIGGLALAALYIYLTGYLGGYVDGDFQGFVRERLGGTCAYLLRFFYLLYAFVNLTYLAWMFAEVSGTFLLPESGKHMLAVLFLICGYYGAAKGVEARGRLAEVLYKLILVPLLVMLLFGAFSIDSGYLAPGRASLGSRTLQQSYLVFTAFGGVGMLLFEVPRCSQKNKLKRALLHGAGVVAFGIFAGFVVMIGAFGEEGLRALPWPAVTLMSNVNLPGDFLQRWDAIFLSILLVSLFVAASTGVFYLGFLAEGFFGKDRKQKRNACSTRQKLFMGGGAFLVFMAFEFCGSYDTAFYLFKILNCYVLVPLLIGFTLILCLIERVRQGRRMKKRTAAAALLLCMGLMISMFAGGCGRELEDRTFPSVLLVRGENWEEAVAGWEQEKDKYTDFGHVKAVVFEEARAEDRPFLKEVLRYMELHPVFARNMLVFFADDTAVEGITYKTKDFGTYLEDRYKNSREGQGNADGDSGGGGEQKEVTLGDVLNFLHNKEENIEIPLIKKEEKEYTIQEQITLSAAP